MKLRVIILAIIVISIGVLAVSGVIIEPRPTAIVLRPDYSGVLIEYTDKATGSPIQNAEIRVEVIKSEFIQPANPLIISETNSNGIFEFEQPAGATVGIVIRKTGYLIYESIITMKGAGQYLFLDIKGTQEIDSSNIQGSWLSLMSKSHPPITDGIVTLSDDQSNFQTITDSDGKFFFSDIPPGVYTLELKKDDWITVTDNELNVFAGRTITVIKYGVLADETEDQIEDPIIPPDETPETPTVRGTVYDNSQDSGAIQGALVRLGGRTTTTDSNGDYIFTDVLPGQYTLNVTKEGYDIFEKPVIITEGTDAQANVILRNINLGQESEINTLGIIASISILVFIIAMAIVIQAPGTIKAGILAISVPTLSAMAFAFTMGWI